jgi:hypothetical protein
MHHYWQKLSKMSINLVVKDYRLEVAGYSKEILEILDD